MFGRNKPVTFDPYGRRRSRPRVPRWLILLLLGVAVGAGGVIWVQERYLPPRLSADASAQLRTAYAQAESARQQLKSQLDETTKKLDAALTEKKSLTGDLGSSRAAVERLQGDLASVVEALPPDPRGGGVEVRAGHFSSKPGMLSYDVVLTRDRTTGKPMPGVLQLAVSGESSRGSPSSVNLQPVSLTIGRHEVVRGSAPLPDGFKPRQATIQVLDRVAGKSLGMRVMVVK